MNRHTFVYLFMGLMMVSLVFGSLPLTAAETSNVPVGVTETPTPAPSCRRDTPAPTADRDTPAPTPTDTPAPTNTPVRRRRAEHAGPGASKHARPGSNEHADRAGSRWFAQHWRCCSTGRSCSLDPGVGRFGRRQPRRSGVWLEHSNAPPHAAIGSQC